MTGVMQILTQAWTHSSAWIEDLNKNHPGLLIVLGLIVTGLALAVALLTLGVNVLATRFAWLTIPTPGIKKPKPLSPELRLRLLEKVLNDRVDPRLSQGLRKAIRLDLGLTETPGAVEPKLRIYGAGESGAPADRPIQGPIQRIFEQVAGGRLLILGEPGTGKTNLLLELARHLISEAKEDPVRPIPVVFMLPRWTLGKRVRSLAEWLKDDLATEYGLARDSADALVGQDRILPLLDGLDEVVQDRRAACVEAIHSYQKDRNLGRLAICCRLAEYEALPKLDLGTAIRVEKLTRAGVEGELAKPHLEYVQRALKADPELWDIVTTPLWLHVLYGAALVQPPTGSHELNPRERLYSRYVEYALGRDADDSTRRRTAPDALLRWLGWLAVEMQRRHQGQFAFEELEFPLARFHERTERCAGGFGLVSRAGRSVGRRVGR